MSKTQKGEKSDKIDNIVGMLMEYEEMTIDLMRKATDTPVLDQYDLNAPYAKARIVKEEGQTKYQIAEVQLGDDEKRKLKDIFFSSRRRHTRFDCDWSSDVCSSD